MGNEMDDFWGWKTKWKIFSYGKQNGKHNGKQKSVQNGKNVEYTLCFPFFPFCSLLDCPFCFPSQKKTAILFSMLSPIPKKSSISFSIFSIPSRRKDNPNGI